MVQENDLLFSKFIPSTYQGIQGYQCVVRPDNPKVMEIYAFDLGSMDVYTAGIHERAKEIGWRKAVGELASGKQKTFIPAELVIKIDLPNAVATTACQFVHKDTWSTAGLVWDNASFAFPYILKGVDIKKMQELLEDARKAVAGVAGRSDLKTSKTEIPPLVL